LYLNSAPPTLLIYSEIAHNGSLRSRGECIYCRFPGHQGLPAYNSFQDIWRYCRYLCLIIISWPRHGRLIVSALGTLSAMILFEYFRFETWAEQSGYLEMTEGALQLNAVSVAGNTGQVSEYHALISNKAHEVVAQILVILKELDKLLQEYYILRKNDKASGHRDDQEPGNSKTPPQSLSAAFKLASEISPRTSRISDCGLGHRQVDFERSSSTGLLPRRLTIDNECRT
jgi:hypothetical protein